jgi:hypothetical protein
MLPYMQLGHEVSTESDSNPVSSFAERHMTVTERRPGRYNSRY